MFNVAMHSDLILNDFAICNFLTQNRYADMNSICNFFG
jgi:hypothetical protein